MPGMNPYASGNSGQFGQWPYQQPSNQPYQQPSNQTFTVTPQNNPYLQGYNWNTGSQYPGAESFGQYMTGGTEDYQNYLNTAANQYTNWMKNFQQQPFDWNAFSNWFNGLSGSGNAGSAPAWQGTSIGNAPGVTAPPTMPSWSWTDIPTGKATTPGAWTGDEEDPHAGLQDVQGYIDSLLPGYNEKRQAGFADAAARAGQSGMAMSTPYAQALGTTERGAENDLNNMIQQSKMTAYENWANRDLQAQQNYLGRQLNAWQQAGTWDQNAQLAQLANQFQAGLAQNQLGEQYAANQGNLLNSQWQTQNQLNSQNWQTQAQLQSAQNQAQNQYNMQGWTQQGNLGFDYAQLRNQQMNNLLPMLMQMYGQGGSMPWGNQGNYDWGYTYGQTPQGGQMQQGQIIGSGTGG